MEQGNTISNLETRLFKPVDLSPGVGFLTNLHRIFNYNSETARIRDETIQSTENPESRDLRRTLIGGLSTLYHVVALSTISTIGMYYNVGEKMYQFYEKLL